LRSALRIVLAGGLGAMPFAGVAWQVLHHLEGLRRLGHNVLYLEDTGRWPYDPEGDSVCSDAGGAVRYLDALMRRHDFDGSWAYRDAAAGELYGLSERALARELRAADVLINLSGVTVLGDQLRSIPARVYLETDPVLPQLEVAAGRPFTIELLSSHTHHFSYGSNFGAPDCGVPIERFSYRATVPPVILDWWTTPRAVRRARPFTTVANWRQREKDFVWQGRTLHWSKDAEFLRIADLPRLTAVPIELALAHDPDDPGIQALTAAGWRIRSARPLSRDPASYRGYIRSSAGELSVAKEQNVVLRSGWFSDRTATYLAAGRPAIVQDTAFDRALPTGLGLLTFRDQAQAADALERVDADYGRHSAAARELARDHLRAEKVLDALLGALS
jgi:hypothetical protein